MSWQKDAEEFGAHIRAGGWRLGFLVARSVNPPDIESDHPEKGSATEFAKWARTSKDRVLRHLDAWDAAASAGHVPFSVDLEPDADIGLDAADLPTWGEFYDARKASEDAQARSFRALAKKGPDRIAEAIGEDEQVLGALAEAMANDPKAKEALFEADKRRWEQERRQRQRGNHEPADLSEQERERMRERRQRDGVKDASKLAVLALEIGRAALLIDEAVNQIAEMDDIMDRMEFRESFDKIREAVIQYDSLVSMTDEALTSLSGQEGL